MREMIMFRRTIEPPPTSRRRGKSSSVEKSLEKRKRREGNYTATRSHRPDLASLETGGRRRGSHESSPAKLQRRTANEGSGSEDSPKMSMDVHQPSSRAESPQR